MILHISKGDLNFYIHGTRQRHYRRETSSKKFKQEDEQEQAEQNEEVVSRLFFCQRKR